MSHDPDDIKALEEIEKGLQAQLDSVRGILADTAKKAEESEEYKDLVKTCDEIDVLGKQADAEEEAGATQSARDAVDNS